MHMFDLPRHVLVIPAQKSLEPRSLGLAYGGLMTHTCVCVHLSPCIWGYILLSPQAITNVLYVRARVRGHRHGHVFPVQLIAHIHRPGKLARPKNRIENSILSQSVSHLA
jgi:hypothetical protein